MSTSAVLEPYQALLQHLRTVQALAQQAAWDECFEHMASYEALSLAVRQLDLVAGCFDAAELARYVTEILSLQADIEQRLRAWQADSKQTLASMGMEKRILNAYGA